MGKPRRNQQTNIRAHMFGTSGRYSGRDRGAGGACVALQVKSLYLQEETRSRPPLLLWRTRNDVHQLLSRKKDRNDRNGIRLIKTLVAEERVAVPRISIAKTTTGFQLQGLFS